MVYLYYGILFTIKRDEVLNRQIREDRKISGCLGLEVKVLEENRECLHIENRDSFGKMKCSKIDFDDGFTTLTILKTTE